MILLVAERKRRSRWRLIISLSWFSRVIFWKLQLGPWYSRMFLSLSQPWLASRCRDFSGPSKGWCLSANSRRTQFRRLAGKLEPKPMSTALRSTRWRSLRRARFRPRNLEKSRGWKINSVGKVTQILDFWKFQRKFHQIKKLSEVSVKFSCYVLDKELRIVRLHVTSTNKHRNNSCEYIECFNGPNLSSMPDHMMWMAT